MKTMAASIIVLAAVLALRPASAQDGHKSDFPLIIKNLGDHPHAGPMSVHVDLNKKGQKRLIGARTAGTPGRPRTIVRLGHDNPQLADEVQAHHHSAAPHPAPNPNPAPEKGK